MKVTVSCGDILLVVPCGDGSISVRQLIQMSTIRLRKVSDSSITVSSLRSADGAYLDPDDRVCDVADDREQLFAKCHSTPSPTSMCYTPPVGDNCDGTVASFQPVVSRDDQYNHVTEHWHGANKHCVSRDIIATPPSSYIGSDMCVDVSLSDIVSECATNLQVRRGSDTALNTLLESSVSRFSPLADGAPSSTLPHFSTARVPSQCPSSYKRWSMTSHFVGHDTVSATSQNSSVNSNGKSLGKIHVSANEESDIDSGRDFNVFAPPSRFSRNDLTRHSMQYSNTSSLTYNGNKVRLKQTTDDCDTSSTATNSPIYRANSESSYQPISALSHSISPAHQPEPANHSHSYQTSTAPFTTTRAISQITHKCSTFISLTNVHGPLGIKLVPETDAHSRHIGLLVQRIDRDGLVYSDGRLSEGDLITQVNGVSLVFQTLDRMRDIFTAAMQKCEHTKQIDLYVELREPINTPVDGVTVDESDAAVVDICHHDNGLDAVVPDFCYTNGSAHMEECSSQHDSGDRVATITPSVCARSQSLQGTSATAAELTATTTTTDSSSSRKSLACNLSSRTQTTIMCSNTRRLGRRLSVRLLKGAQGLGFSVTSRDNARDNQAPIYIKTILSQGAAIEEGTLKVGDRLLEVDGRSTADMDQQQVVTLLRAVPVGSCVHLVLSRHLAPTATTSGVTSNAVGGDTDGEVVGYTQDASDCAGVDTRPGTCGLSLPRPMLVKSSADSADYSPSSSSTSPHSCPASKRTLVFDIPVLESERAGLGISVKGRSSCLAEDSGIFIKSVINGGAASRDGRLCRNDQLIEVNHCSLLSRSNSHAMQVLRRAMCQQKPRSSDTIRIVVIRREMQHPLQVPEDPSLDGMSSSDSPISDTHDEYADSGDTTTDRTAVCDVTAPVSTESVCADQARASHTVCEDVRTECGAAGGEGIVRLGPPQAPRICVEDTMDSGSDLLFTSLSSLDLTAGLSRDQIGRQSISEKRKCSKDPRATETYQRSLLERQARLARTQVCDDVIADKSHVKRSASLESLVAPKSELRVPHTAVCVPAMSSRPTVANHPPTVVMCSGVGSRHPCARVSRTRICNESFRAAVDHSYDSAQSGRDLCRQSTNHSAPTSHVLSHDRVTANHVSERAVDGCEHAVHSHTPDTEEFCRNRMERHSSSVLDTKKTSRSRRAGLFRGLGSMLGFGRHSTRKASTMSGCLSDHHITPPSSASSSFFVTSPVSLPATNSAPTSGAPITTSSSATLPRASSEHVRLAQRRDITSRPSTVCPPPSSTSCSSSSVHAERRLQREQTLSRQLALEAVQLHASNTAAHRTQPHRLSQTMFAPYTHLMAPSGAHRPTLAAGGPSSTHGAYGPVATHTGGSAVAGRPASLLQPPARAPRHSTVTYLNGGHDTKPSHRLTVGSGGGTGDWRNTEALTRSRTSMFTADAVCPPVGQSCYRSDRSLDQRRLLNNVAMATPASPHPNTSLQEWSCNQQIHPVSAHSSKHARCGSLPISRTQPHRAYYRDRDQPQTNNISRV